MQMTRFDGPACPHCCSTDTYRALDVETSPPLYCCEQCAGMFTVQRVRRPALSVVLFLAGMPAQCFIGAATLSQDDPLRWMLATAGLVSLAVGCAVLARLALLRK